MPLSRHHWHALQVLVALVVVGSLSFLSFNAYIKPRYDSNPFPLDTPLSQHHPVNSGQDSDTHILLVSALFPLSKSKHSSVEYTRWLRNFLGPLTTDIYFFTTPDLAPLVHAAASSTTANTSTPGAGTRQRIVTINTTYASPFDVPPVAGLRSAYERMHAQDRERHRHSPELYAVWNAKPFFLSEGLRNAELALASSSSSSSSSGHHQNASAGRTYDFAFWNDAGSFRDSSHTYSLWPDPGRVREVWRKGRWKVGGFVDDSELFFVPIAGVPEVSERGWRAEMGPVDCDFSEGGFFGGAPEAIEWWRRVYYAYRDGYLERGMFVGKEQTVMNAILMVHARRVLTVWYGDPEAPAHVGMPQDARRMLGECGEGAEWFYYQWWFAGEAERKEMSRSWERRRGVGVWWWMWSVWEGRRRREGRGDVEECRVTRVLTIDDVLRWRFGEGWEPPKGLANGES